MDYCVSESMKYNTNGLRHMILYYDIMCQYWVHMLSPFANNHYLELPVSVTHIGRAIGLFHVHGHKDECNAQYAPTFIPGASMVDGKIIDDHMNYSNWKKLLCMGAFVSTLVELTL